MKIKGHTLGAQFNHLLFKLLPPKANQLREIKRKIERRGWSWMSVGSKRRHEFAIWDYVRPTGGTPAGFMPELGRAVGKTEEIAGCLAFEEATEAAVKGEHTHE